MSKVYLVGAGPGDVDLITVRGKVVLGRADLVLYDHLANPALLDLAPSAAEKIYVGKKRAAHALSQEQIIDLMISHARQGHTVVRLKGGDPFIFGRGGEEVEALADAELVFEVVPGVTAPLGIAAYAGVPLTHREHTSVVSFVTGHDLSSVDWNRIAGSETLVIFMGLHHLPEIAGKLIEAGRDPETPAVAVQWGTRRNQRTVSGPLRALPEAVLNAGLTPPTTVIVGAVAGLRNKLTWFEKLPLFGKRVAVTRAREQSGELTVALRELGAEVVQLPVIETVPVPDDDAWIESLPEFDWLIFTSANAVEFFGDRVRDLRRIRGRICAVGPATAKALEAMRLGVDLVPQDNTGEGVAQRFKSEVLSGHRVLFPRAEGAREIIPSALRAYGAHVTDPILYRTILPADAPARIAACAGTLDWVAFTSPSTVANFLEAGGRALLESAKIATIGPTTSDAARKHGLKVHAQAAEPSTSGVVEAITKYTP